MKENKQEIKSKENVIVRWLNKNGNRKIFLGIVIGEILVGLILNILIFLGVGVR